MVARPTLGIYRFSSCDGCQRALVSPAETLQELAHELEILHFPAIGRLAPEREVDLALVEGSVYGEGDLERLRRVRERSRFLTPTNQNLARMEQDLTHCLQHFGLERPEPLLRVKAQQVVRNYDPGFCN